MVYPDTEISSTANILGMIIAHGVPGGDVVGTVAGTATGTDGVFYACV